MSNYGSSRTTRPVLEKDPKCKEKERLSWRPLNAKTAVFGIWDCPALGPVLDGGVHCCQVRRIRELIIGSPHGFPFSSLSTSPLQTLASSISLYVSATLAADGPSALCPSFSLDIPRLQLRLSFPLESGQYHLVSNPGAAAPLQRQWQWNFDTITGMTRRYICVL